MKKIITTVIFLSVFITSISAQELSPFIQVGTSTESIQTNYDNVIKALKSNDFTVIGAYNPSNKSNLKVIAFTRSDVKNTVVKVKDRGALAGIFKVGLVQKNNEVTISYTNPEYLLRAYLRGNYNTYKSVFQKFDSDLKEALSVIGNDFKPFGGTVSAENLKNYHYKVMMPYFTNPVTLGEYSSFEEGLNIIENNLKAKKGSTYLVYKQVNKSAKVAVFGIALTGKGTGESHFLPKIGEAHAAAMPYEIILQDNTATMLDGKFRIALFWPSLTMGTFMKIVSTPGDIEKAFKEVCNK